MAVSERGEVALEIGGKRYTLVLDIDAICELENDTQLRLAQVMEKVDQGSFVFIRKYLLAALRRHHPTVTPKEVGKWTFAELIGSMPGLAADLNQSAVPSKEDAKALGLKRPRKARTAR